MTEVLRSDWLTTGPKVAEFERALAAVAGTAEAVAVSNGTAALHAGMYALDIAPGDEVVVPPMTFASTVNAVVFQGGTPVFADVDPATLLLDPEQVAARITARTKAVAAVDYAGQPCDYDRLGRLVEQYGLRLVDDACHSIGGSFRGRPVGSLATMSMLSFHPVKHVTTGEGGAVTTDDRELARRLRLFRNHGISSDFRERASRDSWFYEMLDLGYNYRLSDIQCALGIAQLAKLPRSIARRQAIARQYDAALAGLPTVKPLAVRDDVAHAYHLYVVQLDLARLRVDRAAIFRALRAEGIGVNVYYIPVHLHPYYRQRFGTGPGLCPVAEAAYERILSLPMFPGMTGRDVEDVIEAVNKVMAAYQKD